MANRDAFDLFAFLGALNRRDLQAYDNLSEEGKKAAHPFVIMRWLSGASDPAQIIRLNEFANRYMFSLGAEKPLLFKLLAASCTGRVSRTNWIKGPSTEGNSSSVDVIKQYFDCSTREATEYAGMLEPTDIVGYAEAIGLDKDQLKKLQTELKLDTGTKRGSKRTKA